MDRGTRSTTRNADCHITSAKYVRKTEKKNLYLFMISSSFYLIDFLLVHPKKKREGREKRRLMASEKRGETG